MSAQSCQLYHRTWWASRQTPLPQADTQAGNCRQLRHSLYHSRLSSTPTLSKFPQMQQESKKILEVSTQARSFHYSTTRTSRRILRIFRRTWQASWQTCQASARMKRLSQSRCNASCCTRNIYLQIVPVLAPIPSVSHRTVWMLAPTLQVSRPSRQLQAPTLQPLPSTPPASRRFQLMQALTMLASALTSLTSP